MRGLTLIVAVEPGHCPTGFDPHLRRVEGEVPNDHHSGSRYTRAQRKPALGRAVLRWSAATREAGGGQDERRAQHGQTNLRECTHHGAAGLTTMVAFMKGC